VTAEALEVAVRARRIRSEAFASPAA
jgi:hypothetical protein